MRSYIQNLYLRSYSRSTARAMLHVRLLIAGTGKKEASEKIFRTAIC